MQWRSEGALILPSLIVTHWHVGTPLASSSIEVFSTGSYSIATARLPLERNKNALFVFGFVVAFLFVFAAYTSFWISPAAAPARVGLGFLCFLLVLNNTNAVRVGRPPCDLSYMHVPWNAYTSPAFRVA